MNHVEIHYSYFIQNVKLLINCENISPYSGLSALLNRSFLEASTHIISGLDSEILDEYAIDLYSTRFQYELLLSLANNSKYCKAIHFHEMSSLLPEDTLLKRLAFISSEHQISIEPPNSILIYCVDNNLVPKDKFFSHTQLPNANIGIFNHTMSIPSTIRTCLLLNDTFGIQQLNGRCCFLIPENKLGLFWEYCKMEFIVLPMIRQYLAALKYTKLNTIEKTELDAIKSNCPAYYIGNLPSSMDQGDSFTIEFKSFPEQSFSLKSDTPSILFCQNGTITANTPGTARLTITDANGNATATKSICIIGHQYIREIRLVTPFEYLKQNQSSQIDTILTPPDAEDANQLVWDSSDPSVIQINKDGTVTALENGHAVIRVSSRNTSSSISIEVKPALQELRFLQQFIRLKNNETIIIDCDIVPSNAPTENLTWEFDNRTIASINPSRDKKRCQITASSSYEGKGNIRCYDSHSKLCAICNIEVLSKIRQRTAGKIALACMILGTFMPYLLPISILTGLYGLLHDPEPERKKRYINCIALSLIILFIWIAAGIGLNNS